MVNENKPVEKERSFSIELRPFVNLHRINLDNGFREHALIEGTIGELEHAEFVDDMVLEILGSKGVLRIDLSEHEVNRKRAGANDPANVVHKEAIKHGENVGSSFRQREKSI